MKYLIVATALLVCATSAAYAEDFEQRQKDVARGQAVCAKHVQGNNSRASYVGGLTYAQVVPSSAPPTPVAYEDGWEKCYAVDKLAVDIKKESEQRDRDFVAALAAGIATP